MDKAGVHRFSLRNPLDRYYRHTAATRITGNWESAASSRIGSLASRTKKRLDHRGTVEALVVAHFFSFAEVET